jgi:hypothetical protein
VAQAVTLLSSIREVPDSNLGRAIHCSDLGCWGLTHSLNSASNHGTVDLTRFLEAIASTVPQIIARRGVTRFLETIASTVPQLMARRGLTRFLEAVASTVPQIMAWRGLTRFIEVIASTVPQLMPRQRTYTHFPVH